MADRPVFGSISEADVRHHKTERRRVLFTIRLTDLEAEMLARAADRAGLTPSQLARARLFTSDSTVERRLERIERLIRQEAGV